MPFKYQTPTRWCHEFSSEYGMKMIVEFCQACRVIPTRKLLMAISIPVDPGISSVVEKRTLNVLMRNSDLYQIETVNPSVHSSGCQKHPSFTLKYRKYDPSSWNCNPFPMTASVTMGSPYIWQLNSPSLVAQLFVSSGRYKSATTKNVVQNYNYAMIQLQDAHAWDGQV